MPEIRDLDHVTRTYALVGRFFQAFSAMELALNDAIGAALNIETTKRFSAKRSAYSDMPSVFSQSAICCKVAAPNILLRDNGCHNANSSSNAFASFRSSVSQPSVNQPYTGASSSRACCGFP